MLKWELPQCPHCGYKLDFFSAFFNRTKGEYKCPNCKKSSDIKFDKSITKVSIICEVIALVVVIFCLFLRNEYSLYGVLFVLIPFIFLYIYSPFLMKLDIIQRNIKKVVPKINRDIIASDRNVSNAGIPNDRQRIDKLNYISINKKNC